MDRRSFLTTSATVGLASVAALASSSGSASAESHHGSVTFIFAHGSWHGGWCWSTTTPDLIAAGHTTIALDLPGHGLDAKLPKSWLEVADRVAQ